MSNDQISLDLHLSGVKDQLAQENFDRIQQTLETDLFRKFIGRFFQFDVLSGTEEYVHGLSFTPTDVIITSNSENADIWFDFEESDNSFVEVTASVATTIRCFLGAYREDTT